MNGYQIFGRFNFIKTDSKPIFRFPHASIAEHGCVRYAVISELMQATFVKDQHHLRTQNISKLFH